ncbi:MAG: DTW domain-containing protein [Oligoflexia bacterium]|nr:DTW domain-containing protein [Oligoflexia bacterium]
MIRTDLCFCSEIPEIESSIRISLVLHHRDYYRPTNTGRVACLALKNSQVISYGGPGVDGLANLEIREDEPTFCLFPSEQSVGLSEHFEKSKCSSMHLIVPDGSWRQARRIAKRIVERFKIPVVRLGSVSNTELKIRHQAVEDRISTMEAIALGLQELGVQEASKLCLVSQIMASRTLWSRAQLPKGVRPL